MKIPMPAKTIRRECLVPALMELSPSWPAMRPVKSPWITGRDVVESHVAAPAPVLRRQVAKPATAADEELGIEIVH